MAWKEQTQQAEETNQLHGNGASKNGTWRIAVNSMGILEWTFERQTAWHAQQLLGDVREAWHV